MKRTFIRKKRQRDEMNGRIRVTGIEKSFYSFCTVEHFENFLIKCLIVNNQVDKKTEAEKTV